MIDTIASIVCASITLIGGVVLWNAKLQIKKIKRDNKRLRKSIEKAVDKYNALVESVDRIEQFTNTLGSKIFAEFARIEREMQMSRAMTKKEIATSTTKHGIEVKHLSLPEGINSPEELASQMLKIKKGGKIV